MECECQAWCSNDDGDDDSKVQTEFSRCHSLVFLFSFASHAKFRESKLLHSQAAGPGERDMWES